MTGTGGRSCQRAQSAEGAAAGLLREAQRARNSLRLAADALGEHEKRRKASLSLAVLLGAASLVSLIVSLHYAELLADWSLPGLAALAAIGSNVMFMVAHKLKRQGR